MWILYVIIFIYALVICFGVLELLFFILPVKSLKHYEMHEDFPPPNFYIKSLTFHMHTEFSYDSLGKPEDIEYARKKEGIDYVIITDHENTHYKCFENDNTIVGMERKITTKEGIVGGLVEVDDLKVVVHPFKKKYFWRLEKSSDLVVELIDLRDAIINAKFSLFWRYIASIIPKIFLKNRIYRFYTPSLKTEYYIKKYFEQGWKHHIIGGLDHHVKIYIREVGIRLLIPPYITSFAMLKNFVYSKTPFKDKFDVLKSLKQGNVIISYVDRPSLFYEEDGYIYGYLPYKNTFIVAFEEGIPTKTILGDYMKLKKPQKPTIFVAYSYMFNMKNLYFGVKPIAISNVFF